jgi:CHAT domain-containing protein
MAQVQIFHYGGHANGSALQLEQGAGNAQVASSTGLAQLLGQQTELKLVFLNGCATQGQVELLLKSGVKAVIATSVPINDMMAVEFAEQFYQSLTNQASIAHSFTTARAFN